MNYANQFLFGIYPYIALAIFLLGSLIRFDREQYTWRSESTQVLHTGRLRLGSILFHVGIIGLLGGHAVGLLTPVWVWDTLGVTHGAKQLFAMAAGGGLVSGKRWSVRTNVTSVLAATHAVWNASTSAGSCRVSQ